MSRASAVLLADLQAQARLRPGEMFRLTADARLEPGRPTSVGISFDEGHHASGWWANADYERCYHLSLTHPGDGVEWVTLPESMGRGRAQRQKLETPSDAEVWEWALVMWGHNARLTWTEPAAPPGDAYRLPNVVHVRLFVDEHDRPFMPLGEVYHLRPTVQSPPKIIDGRLGADVR